MIIDYLIYNLPALCSCSLTCYSWYMAAISHLHATFSINDISPQQKYKWPNSIRRMHRLGLLPLVKIVSIKWSYPTVFSPMRFNCCTLRHFLTLTNVQILEIRDLDIPSFMPRIRRYFAPFLPTLCSLHLRAPKGSNRQIIFFIGLFQHLENLSLFYESPGGNPEEDLTLIPPFTPPLRGRLISWSWTTAGLFRDMFHLFGGMNFKTLNLFNASETRFLLRACAKTLQVLRLHPNDPLSE